MSEKPVCPPFAGKDAVMKGDLSEIEHLTDESTSFRKAPCAGRHLHLVLMTLTPGESVGREIR